MASWLGRWIPGLPSSTLLDALRVDSRCSAFFGIATLLHPRTAKASQRMSQDLCEALG